MITQEVAFLIQGKQKMKVKKGKACSNCSYTNHTLEKCYRPGGPLYKVKEKPEKPNSKELEKAHAT